MKRPCIVINSAGRLHRSSATSSKRIAIPDQHAARPFDAWPEDELVNPSAGHARVHFIPEYYDQDIWSFDYLKEIGVFQQPDVSRRSDRD